MKAHRFVRAWGSLLAVAALVGAACSKSSTTTGPSASTPPANASGSPASVYDVSLKGICPDKIILQTDWFPEPEHGGAYNLIGPGGTIDGKKGTYTGPLRNTGVQMEIRAGGPFIGFQPPVAQMYSDPNITLGYADTGDVIREYGKLPTVAIVAPLQKSPQILMYDPGHYSFNSVSDVKAAGTKVVYFEGAAFMDFLLGTGQLNKAQIDGSYDGSPARWVGSGGSIVEQDYATDGPYRYLHEIKGWMKPVRYLLLYDAGWTIYQSSIVVRPADLTKYSACWAKLVPMWQQSQIDYMKNPTQVNVVLEDIVTKMATFWTLSPGHDEYVDQTLLGLGLVGNGPDGVLGSFDLSRVQKLIDTLIPIYQNQKVNDLKTDLKAEDIVTNQFIDKSIHM